MLAASSRTLARVVSEAEKRAIFAGNAQALYGL